jgi:CubicO group peptidase (beta-lactamase class C family)
VIEIWFQEKDPVTYILEKPLVTEPGAAFNYSTGNMILLGEILRVATRMNIDEFSYRYLFQPLGIDSSSWPEVYPNGALNNTLYITPRAMAKFGLTYLNGGIWNGQRIVSDEWVERSKVDYPGNHDINVPGEHSGKMGYTYSWWTKTYTEGGKTIHMYTASGFGGQHIMVLPEVNSVVVFTGGNYLTRRPPFKILKKYIIPALAN